MNKRHIEHHRKVGIEHVSLSIDLCVDAGDRDSANNIFRQLLEKCLYLSRKFDFQIDPSKKFSGAEPERAILPATAGAPGNGRPHKRH